MCTMDGKDECKNRFKVTNDDDDSDDDYTKAK